MTPLLPPSSMRRCPAQSRSFLLGPDGPAGAPSGQGLRSSALIGARGSRAKEDQPRSSVHGSRGSPARCPCKFGTVRGCSFWRLPAWLPSPNRIGSSDRGRLDRFELDRCSLVGLRWTTWHRGEPQSKLQLSRGQGYGLVTARTVQGMARVWSGQVPTYPAVSDRRWDRGSAVKGGRMAISEGNATRP